MCDTSVVGVYNPPNNGPDSAPSTTVVGSSTFQRSSSKSIGSAGATIVGCTRERGDRREDVVVVTAAVIVAVVVNIVNAGQGFALAG